MRIVIANSNFSTTHIFKRLEEDFDLRHISSQEELTLNFLNEYNPKYIFFPHWSYIIPANIYENFECVVFHMTDLPYGRGGSPLQNLIIRNQRDTKISALRVTDGLDTGDIYLKKDLSLLGRAEEIYLRAGKIILEMIIQITSFVITPIPQIGEVTIFKRRTPSESNMKNISDLESLFDFIRMLDAPNYPKAYLETESFTIEFERASLHSDGEVKAAVTIKKRK